MSDIREPTIWNYEGGIRVGNFDKFVVIDSEKIQIGIKGTKIDLTEEKIEKLKEILEDADNRKGNRDYHSK